MSDMIVSFSRFYGLVNHRHIKDVKGVKETLVSSFTNGRTTSLHEMTVAEYETMCKSLEGQEVERKRRRKTSELRKWRHTCLKLLKDVGVDTNDWSVINAYVSSKKLTGKKFNALGVDELVALSRQLRMIQKHQEK